MANFSEVNKVIKSKYPDLDIEVVRGEGYVYFSGLHGFDAVESIWCDPKSTSTDTVIKLSIQNIEESL